MDEFPHLTIEHKILKRNVQFQFNQERCLMAGFEKLPNSDGYEVVKLRRVYHFNENTLDHIVLTIPKPVFVVLDKDQIPKGDGLGIIRNGEWTKEESFTYESVENKNSNNGGYFYDGSDEEVIIKKCLPELDIKLNTKTESINSLIESFSDASLLSPNIRDEFNKNPWIWEPNVTANNQTQYPNNYNESTSIDEAEQDIANVISDPEILINATDEFKEESTWEKDLLRKLAQTNLITDTFSTFDELPENENSQDIFCGLQNKTVEDTLSIFDEFPYEENSQIQDAISGIPSKIFKQIEDDEVLWSKLCQFSTETVLNEPEFFRHDSNDFDELEEEKRQIHGEKINGEDSYFQFNEDAEIDSRRFNLLGKEPEENNVELVEKSFETPRLGVDDEIDLPSDIEVIIAEEDSYSGSDEQERAVTQLNTVESQPQIENQGQQTDNIEESRGIQSLSRQLEKIQEAAVDESISQVLNANTSSVGYDNQGYVEEQIQIITKDPPKVPDQKDRVVKELSPEESKTVQKIPENLEKLTNKKQKAEALKTPIQKNDNQNSIQNDSVKDPNLRKLLQEHPVLKQLLQHSPTIIEIFEESVRQDHAPQNLNQRIQESCVTKEFKGGPTVTASANLEQPMEEPEDALITKETQTIQDKSDTRWVKNLNQPIQDAPIAEKTPDRPTVIVSADLEQSIEGTCITKEAPGIQGCLGLIESASLEQPTEDPITEEAPRTQHCPAVIQSANLEQPTENVPIAKQSIQDKCVILQNIKLNQPMENSSITNKLRHVRSRPKKIKPAFSDQFQNYVFKQDSYFNKKSPRNIFNVEQWERECLEVVRRGDKNWNQPIIQDSAPSIFRTILDKETGKLKRIYPDFLHMNKTLRSRQFVSSDPGKKPPILEDQPNHKPVRYEILKRSYQGPRPVIFQQPVLSGFTTNVKNVEESCQNHSAIKFYEITKLPVGYYPSPNNSHVLREPMKVLSKEKVNHPIVQILDEPIKVNVIIRDSVNAGNLQQPFKCAPNAEVYEVMPKSILSNKTRKILPKPTQTNLNGKHAVDDFDEKRSDIGFLEKSPSDNNYSTMDDHFKDDSAKKRSVSRFSKKSPNDNNHSTMDDHFKDDSAEKRSVGRFSKKSSNDNNHSTMDDHFKDDSAEKGPDIEIQEEFPSLLCYSPTEEHYKDVSAEKGPDIGIQEKLPSPLCNSPMDDHFKDDSAEKISDLSRFSKKSPNDNNDSTMDNNFKDDDDDNNYTIVPEKSNPHRPTILKRNRLNSNPETSDPYSQKPAILNIPFLNFDRKEPPIHMNVRKRRKMDPQIKNSDPIEQPPPILKKPSNTIKKKRSRKLKKNIRSNRRKQKAKIPNKSSSLKKSPETIGKVSNKKESKSGLVTTKEKKIRIVPNHIESNGPGKSTTNKNRAGLKENPRSMEETPKQKIMEEPSKNPVDPQKKLDELMAEVLRETMGTNEYNPREYNKDEENLDKDQVPGRKRRQKKSLDLNEEEMDLPLKDPLEEEIRKIHRTRFRLGDPIIHYQKFKAATKRYKCHKCSFSANKQAYLKVHVRVHNQPFSCNICSRNFWKIRQLHVHIKTIHGFKRKPGVVKNISKDTTKTRHEQAYKCGFCGLPYTYMKTLQHHFQVHYREEIYNCDECGFETLTQWLMQQHFREHLQKNSQHECDECGYLTLYKDQLEEHMKIHSRRDVYECGKCSFSTAHLGYFQAHIGFHNSRNKYLPSHIEEREECKKTLYKHLTIRTGRKRFKCQ